MNKTIIFDADGTLIDSLWVWDNLVLNFLLAKNKEVSPLLHDILWTMTFKEGITYIKKEYTLFESEDEIERILKNELFDCYVNRVKLFEGVETLLKQLKSNSSTLIVASASSKYLLEESFKKLNIFQYFDEIITEEQYKISKAHSLFFKKLINQFNLDVDNTIVVDDAWHCLKSAKEVNLKTIGILNGNEINKFLKVSDLIINNIEELNEKSINNCWK